MTMAALRRRPGVTKVPSVRGKKRYSPAFWIESAAGSITGFLAILTLVWRDWIEGVFGYDPDHHNGSFEWELVIVCALLTVLFAALARREWRRALSTAGSTVS
jgi:hypothetical protein